MEHPSGSPHEQDFVRLYDATYPQLRRFVERRCAPDHVDDVVSQVYLVAWRRWAAVPAPDDQARAWLYGVAHRTLRNEQRRSRRDGLVLRIADTDLAHPHLEPDLVAARVDLVRAWRRLSAIHQEALALSAWDGLTSDQAADVLGISPVAFRLRLSRARKALRALAGVPHSLVALSPRSTR